jgi:eukaryotic-like serine/threonine-protein kinase
LRLCADACRALDVLHSNDIIHRDVTPGNLLISRASNGNTHVLIADLGVAKSMVDAVGATMTAGTPSYMAPEQAMGVTPLDRRVDIYSLTAVTYAMLTGHPPFLVRSIADILARDTSQPPQPIAERLGAPDTLDAVMVSGLAADRNRRPPTALLLAEALEMIAGQIEAAGAFGQVPKTIMTARHSPRIESPLTAEVTAPDLPPVTGPYPSFAPPPLAPMSGFEPASPYPAAPAQPAFQGPSQPLTGGYLNSAPPYAMSQATASAPEAVEPVRPVSYYIFLALAAVALFAVSMFVTILVLR